MIEIRIREQVRGKALAGNAVVRVLADRNVFLIETDKEVFLEEMSLCRQYWPPLYAYVRGRGHPPHDAQDLVPGFADPVRSGNHRRRRRGEIVPGFSGNRHRTGCSRPFAVYAERPADLPLGNLGPGLVARRPADAAVG